MAKQMSLAAKLDTAAAAGLRSQLEGASDESIVFDAGQVEQLGTLCLELLMSAVVLWRNAGQSITFENISKQMTDDLGRVGLTPDALQEYAA